MSQPKQNRAPRYLSDPRAKYFYKKLASECEDPTPADEFLMAEIAFAMSVRESLTVGRNLEQWKIKAMEKQQEIIANGLRQLTLSGGLMVERKVTNTVENMEIR